MVQYVPSTQSDRSYSSCVAAGDYLFLSGHTGGLDYTNVEQQIHACFAGMQLSLAAAGAQLQDLVQVTVYLRDIRDQRLVKDVFLRYFPADKLPARTIVTSDLLEKRCLCLLDGVAYRAAEDRAPAENLHS